MKYATLVQFVKRWQVAAKHSRHAGSCGDKLGTHFTNPFTNVGYFVAFSGIVSYAFGFMMYL